MGEAEGSTEARHATCQLNTICQCTGGPVKWDVDSCLCQCLKIQNTDLHAKVDIISSAMGSGCRVLICTSFLDLLQHKIVPCLYYVILACRYCICFASSQG